MLTFNITANTNPGLFAAGPAVDPATGDLNYTPAPDSNGSAEITLVLSDDGGTANGGVDTSAPASFTITVNTVNDPPVAVDDSATTDEDTAVDVDVLANDSDSDGNLDPASVTIITLPGNGGTSINPATGVITYTPDPDVNGADSLVYEVCDDGIPLPAECATATVSIHRQRGQRPASGRCRCGNDRRGHALTITLTGSDIDGDPLTFAVATTPGNGSLGTITQLTPTSASVTYTPNADFNGSDSFTFTANDGTVDSAPATISLTVNPVNDPPAADAAAASTDEDTPVTVTLTGSDVDGDPLTFAIASPPANGALGAITQITPTTAEVVYTPNADFNGSRQLHVHRQRRQRRFGRGHVFSLTVNPVNDPPAASPGMATTEEDIPVTITLTGSDVEGDPLTFAIGTGPANGSLGAISQINPTTAEVVYTPNTGFVGPDSFTFTVNDGIATSPAATVSINVTPGNDPPVANDAMVSTDEDNPVAITLTGSDVDGDPLTFAIVSGPGNGSLGAITQLTPTSASVTYTPNANFFGADSFTFTVNDGTDTSPAATVSLTVNAVNDPPTVVDHTLTTHSAIRIALGVGDSGLLKDGAADVDDPPASLNVQAFGATSANGAVLTLVDPATGTYRYDPPGGFTGPDSFTYEVCDSATSALPVQCATGTVNVTVTGPPLWVVNSAAAAGGDGSLNRPFQSLSNLPGGRATGGRIYLFAGNNAGGHSFFVNEHLIGQGAIGSNFDGFLGVQVPANGSLDTRPAVAGTRPEVGGQGVTLAGGALARGFNISTTGTTGLFGSGAFTGIDVREMAVTTTGATAVSLTGLTGDFTLDSVNASGGANGIVLDNTGSAGTFSVTGDGSTAGSGGTISNLTGANGTSSGIGIRLNQAENVAFNFMQLNDFSNFAIRGTSVTDFTLANSVVSGTNGDSAADDEGSISFDNLLGSASFTNNTISGGFEDNIVVTNNSGLLNRMTVTGGTIGLNSTASGNDGILFESQSSATANLTVSGVTFLGSRGDHVQANALGTSTMDVVIRDNTFQNAHTNSTGGGVTIGGGAASSNINLTYDVSGASANSQTFRDSVSSAITVNPLNGAGSVVGTIRNNKIGVSGQANSGSSGGGAGIAIGCGGALTHSSTVNANDVDRVAGTTGAIDLNTQSSCTLNATVTNNNVNELDGFTFAAIYTFSGGASAADTATICADIRNNTLDGSASFGFDIFVDQLAGSSASYNFPGYGGPAIGGAALDGFLSGQNTLVQPLIDTSSAQNVTGTGSSCP